jgi:hypothetical protein
MIDPIQNLIAAGAHAADLAADCALEAEKWPTRPARQSYWQGEAIRHERRAQFYYDRAIEMIDMRDEQQEEAA